MWKDWVTFYQNVWVALKYLFVFAFCFVFTNWVLEPWNKHILSIFLNGLTVLKTKIDGNFHKNQSFNRHLLAHVNFLMEKIKQNFTGWTVNNNSSLQITFTYLVRQKLWPHWIYRSSFKSPVSHVAIFIITPSYKKRWRKKETWNILIICFQARPQLEIKIALKTIHRVKKLDHIQSKQKKYKTNKHIQSKQKK